MIKGTNNPAGGGGVILDWLFHKIFVKRHRNDVIFRTVYLKKNVNSILGPASRCDNNDKTNKRICIIIMCLIVKNTELNNKFYVSDFMGLTIAIFAKKVHTHVFGLQQSQLSNKDRKLFSHCLNVHVSRIPSKF